MNFNFEFKKFNKKNYHRKQYGKILTVRLPCNPIFPIGPIYLADHIHKCFPNLEQQFIDLAKGIPKKGRPKVGTNRNSCQKAISEVMSRSRLQARRKGNGFLGDNNIPAFLAPSNATVATGTPPGI